MHPITSPALIQHFMKDMDSELLLSVFVIFFLLLIDEELLSRHERVDKLFIYIFLYTRSGVYMEKVVLQKGFM